MTITYKILLSFFLILMSGMGFSQSVPSYVPTNGLVGWWGFNGNAQDNSGNGNHGTVNGATLSTDRFGNQNSAYNFNGLNNWIQVQDHISIRPSNITLATWVFLPANTNNYGLITKTNLQTAQGEQYSLQFNNNNINENRFSIKRNSGCSPGNGWREVVVQTVNSINEWQFIVATYDGTTLRYYKNGVLSPNQFTISGGIDNCTGGTLNFGRYWNCCNYLQGKLDDIGIWNRALTQQEITNLYLSQPGGVSIHRVTPCIGDTSSVTISHPTLTGVANASLRLTYNPDSLTYVGFNTLNPAFNGMAINGANGVITMDWYTSSNQTIAAGNMVNLRFRVNGSSPVAWDTLIVPSEFYDSAYNLVPQTFSSGSVNHRTTRLVWNRNICEGQSFTLGNQSYTTSGTFQGRRFGTGGACDTLITLNLSVLPRQTNPSVTVCSNQPYSFNGVQLNTSGVYLDTLVNILGCDSIVQLNLTVNPAYNQNLTMTICAGGSLQFGSQNLTVAGNYTNTFVSSRGCDSLVNLSLNVSNSTTIVSSNGQNGFCPNGSVRIGLTNPQPNATYTWRKDGIIIPNASSDTLFVNQTGNYQLAVQVSPNCIISSNTLAIGILNCNRITGDLRYDNTNQTPLAGVPVHLKTLLGNIVASDTTDSSGNYDMASYSNGNYLLDAAVNYTWGGVNSTDALQVTRYFTSLVSLSPLRIKVGDVNGSGITNSGDALLINRRITGLISSFSVGNFVSNLPSVNALGIPWVANLRALSTGDVNGTYNPQPTAPTLVLDTVYGNGNVGTAVVRFTNAGSGVFERGVVWSSSPNPTLTSNMSIAGTGGFGFTHSFSSIDPNNIQYARAYARTSAGVYYSPERSFTPIPGLRCPGNPTVTDIDGNLYYTVQIGMQCWTQSNLKVSKYKNGNNIPTGLSNADWQNTTSGAYAIYNNDPVNDGLYGKLYNHYAVTDSRGLCPTGWHVPSDGEWTILENHLSGSIVAGGALKSTSTQPTPGGWASPNTGATNSSGFTATPGGYRHHNGDFFYIAYDGYWWSSSVSSASNAWRRYLFFNYSSIIRGNNNRSSGFSVRCLKNTLPQVNTTSVTNVTTSTALVAGEVISDGSDQNTIRGFCYSTTPNPTISNDTTMNGTGLGVYTGTLQNLTPLTTYYFRAYATNSVGTSYGSELNFTITITIGSNYAGGIVFYIDSTGQHGLACAPSDQGNFQWGCHGTDIVGTSTAFGTGQANTNLILSGCSNRPIAVSVCDNLVMNGYSDWYLPSIDELQLMYSNLHVQSIGGFLNSSNYWSSSQYNPYSAWSMVLSSGDVYYVFYKSNNFQVRAVRAF